MVNGFRVKRFGMKKILYLITSSEYGGAQKYVFDLAVNLPPEYQAMVAAGSGDGELFSRLTDYPKVKTIKIFNLKRLPGPFAVWKCLKEIIKLLSQEKPDILHLNSTVAGCLGSWSAKIYKKRTKSDLKVIYTVHGWVFLEPGFLKSQIYFLAEKISSKWKDLFIVLSEKDRSIGLAKKIASPKKIIKIYNGIDVSALKILPKEKAREILPDSFRQPNQAMIGVIANLYATKGLDFLIKAIALIKKNGQTLNTKYQIIGDGPERKNLERLIAKLNLSDCVFLAGRIPEASKYLTAFDIFVLPSIKEGMPFVILEAMAAEVPIIATKVGAIPEMIENNVSGILVEPKNPTVLAKAIEEFLSNPAKQKNLAENARHNLEKFSLKSMLSQTYLLYSQK